MHHLQHVKCSKTQHRVVDGLQQGLINTHCFANAGITLLLIVLFCLHEL